MQCPKCQQHAADFRTSEGVTVNFCQGCKGLWFERGELALYCETPQDLPHLDTLLAQAQPTAFHCSKCQKALLTLPYMAGEDLYIEWCPQCHGVWVDAGELPKIERLATRLESGLARAQRAMRELQRAGYQVIGTRWQE